MSKLNRQLQLTNAGRRQPMPAPLSCVEVTDTWAQNTPVSLGMYTLNATFRCQVTFDPSRKVGMSPTEAVRCARRAVISDVFGEFRQNFDAIYGALARHDWNGLRAELSRFEAQMFDISRENSDE